MAYGDDGTSLNTGFNATASPKEFNKDDNDDDDILTHNILYIIYFSLFCFLFFMLIFKLFWYWNILVMFEDILCHLMNDNRVLK